MLKFDSKTVKQRERDRVSKRIEKEEQAKRDGTYVHKRRARPGPHWAYCCPQDPDLCYCEDCWDGVDCVSLFPDFPLTCMLISVHVGLILRLCRCHAYGIIVWSVAVHIKYRRQ